MRTEETSSKSSRSSKSSILSNSMRQQPGQKTKTDSSSKSLSSRGKSDTKSTRTKTDSSSKSISSRGKSENKSTRTDPDTSSKSVSSSGQSDKSTRLRISKSRARIEQIKSKTNLLYNKYLDDLDNDGRNSKKDGSLAFRDDYLKKLPGNEVPEKQKQKESAIHVLDLMKRMQVLEHVSLYNQDQLRILSDYFSNRHHKPTPEVAQMIDLALSDGIHTIIRLTDQCPQLLEKTARKFIEKNTLAKRVLLETMLEHPKYIPHSWGGPRNKPDTTEVKASKPKSRNSEWHLASEWSQIALEVVNEERKKKREEAAERKSKNRTIAVKN